MIVVASALLEVLLNTPAAARVGERLFAAGETLHAPHLLADLPLNRYSPTLFLPRRMLLSPPPPATAPGSSSSKDGRYL